MRNWKGIKLGLTGLALSALTPVLVHAQEIEVGVLGGVSAVKQGQTDLLDGTNFGIAAVYYQSLNENWKLGLGVEFGFFEVQQELFNPKGSFDAIDSEGDNFELRYGAKRYQEQLSGSFLGIPVKLQYESASFGGDRYRVYASAGIKYQVYLSPKTKLEVEDWETSGYYPQLDAVLNAPDFAGFGSFGNENLEVDSKLKDGLFALAELGVRYDIAKGGLYLGVYGEVDMVKANETQTSFVSYNKDYSKPAQLQTTLGGDKEDKAVRFFNVGLKLKYTFGL